MKLVYWVCRCKNDSKCYSVRARTKKAAAKERKERGEGNYDPPVKVTIEYQNAFDLMSICCGEGGIPEPW